MKDMGVIGIDLSGNPTVGEWWILYFYMICISFLFVIMKYGSIFKVYLEIFRKTFFPALKFAREQGLSVTLHCGEVLLLSQIYICFSMD